VIDIFQCDIAVEADRMRLYQYIQFYHPRCNVIVNNAAIVNRTGFRDDPEMVEKAIYEMNTNFLAPFALTKLFLPMLEANGAGEVIYITTGLVYARGSLSGLQCIQAAFHSLSNRFDGRQTRCNHCNDAGSRYTMAQWQYLRWQSLPKVR
jgi:uncharacterized oxidoreductase